MVEWLVWFFVVSIVWQGGYVAGRLIERRQFDGEGADAEA